MRSSSSRNLASSPNNNRALRNQIHPQYYYDPSEPHEKFICMQFMQALLFTARITFLLYNLVETAMHKERIYQQIGKALGGSARHSENIYMASLGLISLFLISLIIFTFVYNYMLVHENMQGIIAMGAFLILMLIYYGATFGRYSVIESSIVCLASLCEILGLAYLVKLIKHKKQIRYEHRIERRSFSTENLAELNGNGSPNRQLLRHHRRMGDKGISATPPSITISYTGSDDHEQKPEEEMVDSDQVTSSQPEDDEHNKSDHKIYEHSQAEESDTREPSSTHGHCHRNKHSSRSKHYRANPLDNESESSASVAKGCTQHSHGHHESEHRSRDHLTVPGQHDKQEEDEEEGGEEDEKVEEPSEHKSPPHHPSDEPPENTDQWYQSGSQTRPAATQYRENAAYNSNASPRHQSYVDSPSKNYLLQSAHHHHQQHQQQYPHSQHQQAIEHYPPPQLDYYQQPMYHEYREEYGMQRSPNYRR